MFHNAPADCIDWVNRAQTASELDALRKSVNRRTPYGSEDWMMQITNMLQLGFTLHRRRRPKPDQKRFAFRFLFSLKKDS
jgi:hypothetical protein